jgi:enoyl-CoA hydratase
MSIKTEKKGTTTIITICRPEVRNAVNFETAKELAVAWQQFDEDDEALVGIFCGEETGFCAGYDLKEVASGSTRHRSPEGNGPMGPSRMVLSKPVIAAITGYAVAGGLELALWCDMRVAEEDAVLGVFCRRWGVPLIDGGTVRLPRIVGMGRALDLIMTGRPVGAEEALAMGLVNRVVPKGHARAESEKLAAEISQFPQPCMRSDRMSAYEQFDLSFEEAMRNEFRHGMRSLEVDGTRADRFVGGKGRGGSFKDL